MDVGIHLGPIFIDFTFQHEAQEAVREPGFPELCWLLGPRWPIMSPWRSPGLILKRFSMISCYQKPFTKVSGAVLGANFKDFRRLFDNLDPLELLWDWFLLPWTMMIIMKHMCQMNNNEPYESYEPYVNHDEPYEPWSMMNPMNHDEQMFQGTVAG